MRRLIPAFTSMLFLAGSLLAVPQGPKKETSIHCTLTDKNVKKCCCIEKRDGKLYCKLAKKTIEKCCCEPAQFPKAQKS